MPTGYTDTIPNGITFKEFALNCARAFGACVTLKDEPLGGDKIPDEFQPENYHLEAISKVKASIKELNSLSKEEIEYRANKNWENTEASRIRRLEEIRQTEKAYRDMLKSVQEWNPPSPEHKGLKDFMVEQIESSINFDCDARYYIKPTKKVEPSVWFENEMRELKRSLTYHKEGHKKELERVSERNNWIRQLRESLR